jgi:hypothetical protein
MYTVSNTYIEFYQHSHQLCCFVYRVSSIPCRMLPCSLSLCISRKEVDIYSQSWFVCCLQYTDNNIYEKQVDILFQVQEIYPSLDLI